METQKKLIEIIKNTKEQRIIKVGDGDSLDSIEKEYRNGYFNGAMNDYMPWAQNTPFREIAEEIFKDQNGSWVTPVFYSVSYHKTNYGMGEIARRAYEYINKAYPSKEVEVLSISTNMEGARLGLKMLVRSYVGSFDIDGFYDELGEDYEKENEISTSLLDDGIQRPVQSGHLVIPDEIKNYKLTQDELEIFYSKRREQDYEYDAATKERPFLNRIAEYLPAKPFNPADKIDMIYDLKTSDMQTKLICSYDKFISVFQEIMNYVNGVEYYQYINVMKGEEEPEVFIRFLEKYIEEAYIVTGRFNEEDMPALMAKLKNALFHFYVVQDLINDPQVTDIKITGPDAIRARVKGKAYMSNINFIDKKDYLRFVDGIILRNKVVANVPEQTFTDTSDADYQLRLTLSAEYATGEEWPYLHIRKIDRHKLLSKELIEAGMFDEKIKNYLLDCGKNSRGVVFAGPPGSGKTVCLNWFLEEAYEQSAEILVIQENDELFCYRKGVMFQHVVQYPEDGEMPVNLEQLGQLALVAGANVFVIGEAKGAEICSAITLSNSGCRTAITIHSPSSTETIDKMADLAMRGYAKDIDQAKRMLHSFQTIVYLENFSIKEISEITGYNENTHEMEYKYIYRKED